jgi:hypothetical protein
MGDPLGRQPQRCCHGPSTIRGVDANTRCGRRSRARADRLRHRPHTHRNGRYVPSKASTSAVTARCSPRPSPPTPSGFTGHSAPMTGYCFASTVRCWRTAAALAAATFSSRTAHWSRPMRKRRCCAFARPQMTSTLDPARTFAYRTSRERLRIRFSLDKNDK